MALLGVHLTVLIGSSVPSPLPVELTNAVERVEVTQRDEGRAGFQIMFKAGRDSIPIDYPLLRRSRFDPFNRVILMVTFNAIPRVLIDGMITDQQLMVSNEPGASIFAVTGEDVSVMMDLEEKIVEHPAQNELMIANKIIAKYARYGLIPTVIPPPVLDVPLPIQRIPVQHGTDLDYLRQMAERYAYVFYVTPGPAPGTNIAYWGPPKRVGVPQSALTVNMGASTNVASINFRYDALAPQTTSTRVQDSKTNKIKSVKVDKSTRLALSSHPALRSQSKTRERWLSQVGGLREADARARAQASTNASVDHVVTAEGELDVMRYGHILQARRLVGVRGVGQSYDGMYIVKNVTHIIEPGAYKQRFTLSREGVGTLTPVVRP